MKEQQKKPAEVWIIAEWDRFETYESRKLKGALQWIAHPTDHSRRGWKRVARSKQAIPAIAAWYPMCQVAAKMPVRGVLATNAGPLTAEDLAEYTLLPASLFKIAIERLSSPDVAWVQVKPWDHGASFIDNMERVLDPERFKEFTSRLQQPAADRSRRQRKPADGSGSQQPPAAPSGTEKTAASLGDPLSPQQPPADPSGSQQPPADPSGLQQPPADPSGLQRTVQDSTPQTDRHPLPSPNGRLPADSGIGAFPAGTFIADFALAKKIICKEILGGKDPSRPWSYDADYRLSELVKPPGLPVDEIRRIAWFRRLPDSEEIPELRDRKTVTETGLVNYWGDEFTRADAYWRKNHQRPPPPPKKDPPEWREFFYWKYDPTVRLPETYAELDDDLKAEYERDYPTYQRRGKAGTK